MTMNDDMALGYLVGAIDGEGSFMLTPATDLRVLRQGRPSLSIRPRMEIENTCEAFIDKVEAALQILGIAPGFRISRSFKDFDKTRHFEIYGMGPHPKTLLGGGKNYYRLGVNARGALRRLIDLIRNETAVKKQAVEIVLGHLDRVGDSTHYRATEVDLEDCLRLFELQGRRRTPFPMAKWTACLRGDYAGYRAQLREATPCQAEGTDTETYLGRRRDQSVRKS